MRTLNCYILDSGLGYVNKIDVEPLTVYRDKIAEMCGHYGVDCIDICDIFPEPKTQGDEYTVDGLHPNNHGHHMIAERLKKYLVDNGKL